MKTMKIIIAYPFVILIAALLINVFIIGMNPHVLAMPSLETIRAIVISGVLLVINHTWLMTTTELTRARFRMFSTPEEWAASETNPEDCSREGIIELKRQHDTHLNNTENIIYYIFLSIAFIFISPPVLAAQILIIGYAVSRLMYSYSFLAGKDGMRGLFMTLSLLLLYCMACYLALGLVL